MKQKWLSLQAPRAKAKFLSMIAGKSPMYGRPFGQIN